MKNDREDDWANDQAQDVEPAYLWFLYLLWWLIILSIAV